MSMLMNIQQIMARASQIMQSINSPQMLIQQFLPGVPQEMQNDPNKIIEWLQQTGKVSANQLQIARQMSGMKR